MITQSLNLLAASPNLNKKAEALIDMGMTRNDMNQPEKAIPCCRGPLH
ncbi:MAG: hypothetical protein R3C61_15215 [Bacteroidia bacterium]